MIEIIKLALAALWGHKLRAFLTTLGIAIGVFTVGTVMAIIHGLNTSFSDQISMLGSDVFYISTHKWGGGYEEWIRSWRRKPITPEAVNYILDHGRLVDIASPMLGRRSTLKFNDKSLELVQVAGVNQYALEIDGSDLAEGRFFSAADVSHRKNVVVIGDDVRQEFFPGIDPLGQILKISGHKFTVIGCFVRKGQMLGNNMDNRVQIPYLTFSKFFGGRRTNTTIAAKAVSPDLVDDAYDELRSLLRHYRRLKPQDEDDFAINQISSIMELYNKMTAMLWAVAIGIGSISLIVGGIGVMNIMLVTVAERTKEIGIRKSIGATRSKILFQFLVESMVVCALGVILGLTLASGVAFAVQKFTPLAASIPANWGLLGAGTVVIVGLVFGLWPANKAAKLDPIEALHYG
ncbi:MAG: FtsX-like permease family protein [FCB group bacterium]|nr:FtsX-like permease family protein [FCB group bacterium]